MLVIVQHDGRIVQAMQLHELDKTELTDRMTTKGYTVLERDAVPQMDHIYNFSTGEFEAPVV